MRHFEYGLPCARCGYDLRTLPRAGVCPECGLAIVDSIAAAAIRRAELGTLRSQDARWLRSIRRGTTLACVAASIQALGFFYLDRPPSTLLAGTLWLTPVMTIFVVSHLAAWHVLLPRRRRGLGIAARVLIVASLCAVALMFLNDPWAFSYGRALAGLGIEPPEGLRHAAVMVGKLASLLWPIAVALTCARLAQLAWLARGRPASIAIGLTGAAASIASGLLAVTLAVDPGPTLYSGEIAPMLIGPTATNPMPWAFVALGFVNPTHLTRMSANELVLLALPIALTIAHAAALLWLRAKLGRAIRLGELPDASTRR